MAVGKVVDVWMVEFSTSSRMNCSKASEQSGSRAGKKKSRHGKVCTCGRMICSETQAEPGGCVPG